jgi:hypothetical protein
MKRSEMIKIMFEWIQNEVEYDYDCYMDRESTDQLLAVMEKAGMKPKNDEWDKE